MRPSQVDHSGMHCVIGQDRGAVVAYVGVGVFSARGIEQIPVPAEEEAVAGRGLIVKPWRKDKVVALPRLRTQVGVQCVDHICNLLQVTPDQSGWSARIDR